MTTRSICAAVAVSALVVGAVPVLPQEPIRVATRLVQVNVVVHKDGQPVADLTRDDFRVLENGKEQAIELFELNVTPASSVITEAAPAVPTFTNRIVDRTTTVSVILIDNLNTGLVDQLGVRNQAIAFLRELRPTDRVAVYLVDNSDAIRVLHDFSSDTKALIAAVSRVQTRTSNQVAAAEDAAAMSGSASIADSGASPELVAWLAGVDAERANEDIRDRVIHFNIALETIARHLGTVRGRKNLIWISSAFPIVIGNASGMLSSLKAELNTGLRSLNDANVAVYPVDARRLIGAFSSRAADKQQSFTTLSTVRSMTDTMEVVADETGGRAYFNTNDLRGAMRRAIDDSRVSYVLGYYPTNTKWDGGFRQIKVEVKRRGVEVRHRKGYLAAPTILNTTTNRRDALHKAALDPLQATEIILSAQVAKPPTGAPSSVELTLRLDPGTITFTQSGERWTGEVDVIVAEAVVGRAPTLSFSTTLTLDLSAEQRARILAQGISLTRTIPFEPKLHQLRIVALDIPSGAVGSVHISGEELRRAIQH